METRRGFLGRVALGLGVLACRAPTVLAQPAERADYVAIETSAQTGASRARFLSRDGASLGLSPLDFRAHGMARHVDRLAVFPRRPGDRFAIVDTRTLDIVTVVTAPPERHFFGHGAFTLDGSQLLVTENRLDTLAGSIGVYDAREGFPRLGQIDLPGPGPHEMIRAPDRDVFHVAIGGLETHPAYGRTPLNLDTFRSQIVTLDHARGTVETMGFWSGTEGISLRHLAADGAGRLFVGGQLADARRGASEAVLWSCADGRAEPIAAGARLAGYVSSIASHGTETWVTSKEANTVLTLKDGEMSGVAALEGASGVALGRSWSGVSGYRTLRIGEAHRDVPHGYEFDNHAIAIR